MANGELCIDCVQRTNQPAGRIRNFCASLALGRNYVAPDCSTKGPFIAETSYQENPKGSVATILKEGLGCAKVTDPSKPVVIYKSGGELVSMTLGDEVIFPYTTSPQVQE